MKRVLTALLGIPLVILLIRFTPDSVTSLVVLVAMLLALREYFAMTRAASFPAVGYVLAAVIVASFYFPDARLEMLFPFTAGWVLIVGLFSRKPLPEAFRSSALTLFGIWYVGGLMGYLIGIRRFDSGGETGSDLLMLLFVIIWANDTFAYFFGKTLGRHKLAPVVSPHKTIEGAVAGFVFGILACIAGRYVFVPQISLMDSILVAALVGVMGQIGDLCESLLKRAVDVKDSGSILPGHGGMLDRVDSLLFGAPAMYYYFYLFLNR